MTAFTTFEVQIYNNAATPALQGTITSAFDAGGSEGINEIGNGYFAFPADDSAAKALVLKNRVAVVRWYNEIGTQYAIVCAFIIHQIEPQLGRPNIIRASGPGLLHELTYDNLAYNLISDGSGGPANNWLSQILSYANNSWTSLHMDTSGGNVYLQASGETVHDAIVKGFEQHGRALTYNLYDAPTRRITIINNPLSGAAIFDFDDLDFVQPADPSTVEGTFEKSVIRSIKIIEESTEIVTRLYVYGAGLGAGRLTIDAADGLYTPPAGFSIDFANSLVTNTSLEAESEQLPVTRVKQFAHIKPETLDENDANYTAAQQNAAIQLAKAAIEYLEDRVGATHTFYEIESLAHGNYVPGQLANINFSNADYTINGDFVIHRIAHRVNGVERVSSFLLGDPLQRRRPTGHDANARALKHFDEVIRHATSTFSPDAPNSGNLTNDATFVLMSNHPNIPNRRLLTEGDGIDITDSGAGQPVTLKVGLHTVDPGLGFLAGGLVLGDPLSITSTSTNTRAGTNHSHAIDGTIATSADLHDAVTLAADVQVLLGLTGQEIFLQNKAANLVFAGPASGAATNPDYRSLVFNDLPIGNGLTNSGTNLILGTPSTNSVSSTNSVTATSHTHAITSSSNPGAAASILATDSNGELTVEGIGIGLNPPQHSLDVFGVGVVARFGDGTASAQIRIDGGAGANRDLIFRSGNSTRWVIRGANQTTESGSNAGSDFQLRAHTDAGAVDYVAMHIERSSGIISIKNTLDQDIPSASFWAHKFSANDTVAHGMTNYAATDQFGAISMWSSSQGGCVYYGYSESNTATVLSGYGTGENTTDTSTSRACVEIETAKANGINIQDITNSGNLFAVRNNGTTRLVLKGNGALHLGQTGTTALDDYDDIALARQFQIELSCGRGIKPSILDSRAAIYSKDDLERAGIIKGDFVSVQGSISALLGGVVQIGAAQMESQKTIDALSKKIAALEQASKRDVK